MAIVNEAEIVAGLETSDGEQQLQIPGDLPVLPLRDIVIYPFMIVPLFVSREKSIRAVDEALGENRMILLASQKDPALAILDLSETLADFQMRLADGIGGATTWQDKLARLFGLLLLYSAYRMWPRRLKADDAPKPA